MSKIGNKVVEEINKDRDIIFRIQDNFQEFVSKYNIKPNTLFLIEESIRELNNLYARYCIYLVENVY